MAAYKKNRHARDEKTPADHVLFQGIHRKDLEEDLKKDGSGVFDDSLCLEAGDFLFEQGQDSSQAAALDRIYFVQSGRMTLIRSNDSGSELVTGFVLAGDVLIEPYLYRNLPVWCTVRADVPVKLLPISFAHIEQRALDGDPSAVRLMINMSHLGTARSRELARQLDMIALKTPEQRIASFFLDHRLYRSDPERRTSVPLPMKKGVMAQFLGMTAETFSRSLSKLREEGIHLHSGYMTLNDDHALCSWCDVERQKNCPFGDSADCPLQKTV